jgi:hypothetical protein
MAKAKKNETKAEPVEPERDLNQVADEKYVKKKRIWRGRNYRIEEI